MVHYTTAGESHGAKLISIIEGIPAGVKICTDDIVNELALRRKGIGRGDRQKFELDKVELISGVIQGVSIASPIAISIENAEWEKWNQIMSVDYIDNVNQIQPNMPKGNENNSLQTPRPGHADLEGVKKYGFSSAREVLERSSARETAARVASGIVAYRFLEQLSEDDEQRISIDVKVVQFGKVKYSEFQSNSANTAYEKFLEACQKEADEVIKNRQTIGGIIEITVNNFPRGFGSYISQDRKLDASLSQSLMSIQAFKGVEFGEGFNYANIYGTDAHDEIKNINDNITRVTNHAGGIEGGMSNGMPIVIRCVVKPIPSVPDGLKTVDLMTKKEAISHPQRSDASAVFPACIVAKSMVAIVLADEVTRRYGADRLDRIKEQYNRNF